MTAIAAPTEDHAFDERIRPYRRELVAHCYRMLGAVHDAEDVVQETYLRAWRARTQYDESRSSVRTWLYRIATNACLTALASGRRRPLPSGAVAPSDPQAPFVRGEVPWLQPVPDTALDPADRASVRLAFVAALQFLSARQRAVLVLRDVLGFSAAETAEILQTSAISVNSALRRARTALAGIEPDQVAEPSGAQQRAWVDAYVSAFRAADVDAITGLLSADVVMEMPPMQNWFAGRDNYATFMRWVFDHNGTDWLTRPSGANGQPAFAAYVRDGERYRLHTLQVITAGSTGISRLTVFQDDDVFATFDLPPELPVPERR